MCQINSPSIWLFQYGKWWKILARISLGALLGMPFITLVPFNLPKKILKIQSLNWSNQRSATNQPVRQGLNTTRYWLFFGCSSSCSFWRLNGLGRRNLDILLTSENTATFTSISISWSNWLSTGCRWKVGSWVGGDLHRCCSLYFRASFSNMH